MTTAVSALRGRAARVGLVAAGAPVLALVLGAIQLGSKSLWYDETYTAWSTRGSWSRLWSIVSRDEEPHGVYYAIVKTVTDVAGTSEWALRLPSILAAAAAAWIVFLLGRRLFDAATGAVAAFLLALNPFVVIWSQQARSYAFVLLAACVSTLALVHALDRGRPRAWALYAAAACGGLLLHPFVGLVVPAHVAAAWAERSRVRLAAAVSAFAAVGVLAVPVALATVSRDERLTAWLHRPDLVEVVKAVVLVAGVGPLGIALAAAGVLTVERLGMPRWKTVLLVTWVVAPFAITIAVSFVKPVFAPRYLIVAVPPFALLGAVWLASTRRRLAVAVGTAVAAWGLAVAALWYDAPPLENWRGATRDTLAAARPGDDVLYAPAAAVTGFEYYAGRGVAHDRPRARTAWLLVWGDSPQARRLAGAARMGPGYRLAELRPVDDWLAVERWVRRAG